MIARGAKNIFIATPILDQGVYQNLLTVCDGVFCPYKIRDYISIEYYYKEFEQFSFEEISEIINKQVKLEKKTSAQMDASKRKDNE